MKLNNIIEISPSEISQIGGGGGIQAHNPEVCEQLGKWLDSKCNSAINEFKEHWKGVVIWSSGVAAAGLTHVGIIFIRKHIHLQFK